MPDAFDAKTVARKASPIEAVHGGWGDQATPHDAEKNGYFYGNHSTDAAFTSLQLTLFFFRLPIWGHAAWLETRYREVWWRCLS